MQCNFNILDNRIYEKKLWNILKSSKIDLVARSIFCFSFFTEKFLRSEISYRKMIIGVFGREFKLKVGEKD